MIAEENEAKVQWKKASSEEVLVAGVWPVVQVPRRCEKRHGNSMREMRALEGNYQVTNLEVISIELNDMPIVGGNGYNG